MDDISVFAIFGLVGAVICAVIGYAIAERGGRGAMGAVLGLLLGPIGLIGAWVIRDNALRDAEERERQRRPSAALPGRRTGLREPPAQPASQSAVIADLDRIATMRAAGHITDEEFQRLKAGLIGHEPKPRTSRFR